MIILLCKTIVAVFPARSVCIARACVRTVTCHDPDVLTGRSRAHDLMLLRLSMPVHMRQVCCTAAQAHDFLAEYQLHCFQSIAHTPVNNAKVESPSYLQSCNRLVTSARSVNKERGTKPSLKSEKQSSKACETMPFWIMQRLLHYNVHI